VNFTGYTDEAVRLTVDLVNTYNPRRDTDRLDAPAALSEVLDKHQFTYSRTITGRDLEQVRTLRRRLRAVFETESESEAASIINAVLAESGALPRLTDHDGKHWHVHYTSEETPLVDRLGSETAMGLAVVITDGGFDRMRVCQGEGCLDVFVDMSRNRSRRFCSPEICGNRASVTAYRQRQRQTGK